jgi:hypothetical protein
MLRHIRQIGIKSRSEGQHFPSKFPRETFEILTVLLKQSLTEMKTAADKCDTF